MGSDRCGSFNQLLKYDQSGVYPRGGPREDVGPPLGAYPAPGLQGFFR